MDLLTELTILVLAAFVGFEVISKVLNTLHTPLMSATNAIHGIVLVGGHLADRRGRRLPHRADPAGSRSARRNIHPVGGFLVTDRMLEMFKKRPEPARREVEDRAWEA